MKTFFIPPFSVFYFIILVHFFIIYPLPLDDGEGCVCVQMISYSLLCKYFRRAVLPADKALYADIYRQRTRLCDRCGKPFAPGSNRQKYCPECGRSIRRKQKADSARRRRSVEH